MLGAMNRTGLAALTAAALAFAAWSPAASARDLTVVSWGGSYQDAQGEAFFDPFQDDTGIPLLEDSYNGGLAKIRSMVQTGAVTWDVVQAESPALMRGCQEGLFARLPWDEIGDRDQFLEGGASVCGAGTIVWSIVLAYNADNVDGQPSGWDDFFDVETYPGTRALRKGAKFNLEIALMADGVAPENVYDVLGTEQGVDRAFDKLSELKGHVQWWEAGAQPPEWLAAGDVVMSTAYNGRITKARQEEGQPFRIAWEQQIYAIDSWAMIRGTPNRDKALEFIKYVSQPENMARLPEHIPYGPPHKKAVEMVPEDVVPNLPTAPSNLESALKNSTEFWVANEERLDKRFQSWIQQ